MSPFKDDTEMLAALDDFIFKTKGLKSELKDELISRINAFLEHHNLSDPDNHNFINTGINEK